jgi:hypothetical protein
MRPSQTAKVREQASTESCRATAGERAAASTDVVSIVVPLITKVNPVETVGRSRRAAVIARRNIFWKGLWAVFQDFSLMTIQFLIAFSDITQKF